MRKPIGLECWRAHHTSLSLSAGSAEDRRTAESGATLFTGTGDQTRVGWTVGIGAEWAMWNNWSAKLEYDFMNFGSKTATINGVIGPGVINAPASFGLVNDQTISEVKFGLNYKIMPLLW